MRVTINGKILEVVKGDITDESTDAIVNAANNHLWMGAGVAGAIKRRGGERIEEEAVAQGPVEPGEAVLTSAGALSARYVLHAAVMGQDLHTSADLIRRAYVGALAIAEREQLASVSVPALGTGVGGFSAFHAASILIGVSVDVLQRAKSLRHIRIVLFDDELLDAFTKELRLQFSSQRH